MRLRYLHLPRCGPLTDTAVVFGREDLIARTLNLPRKGSLNLVVGLNGSGKSSLLRAVYRAFRALKEADWPDLPVSIVWDIDVDGTPLSSVLHYANAAGEQPFIAVLKQIPRLATKSDWSTIIQSLADGSSHPLVQTIEVEIGADSILNPPRRFRLPKRMIAYSSGDDSPWLQLEQHAFKGRDDQEDQYQIEDERPLGWSMDHEWGREQPGQTAKLLKNFTPKVGDLTHNLPSPAWKFDDVKMGDAFQFIGDFKPINEVRKKLWSNQQIRAEQLDDSFFRVQSRHLRFAGITMTLCQAAKEMAGRTEERHREALRILFVRRLGRDAEPPIDPRRVLNEIDWFGPTHLSITYHNADDRVSPRQHQELLCLIALADEVIAQPRGRLRAIISLGASDRINLTEKLKDAFPLGIPSKSIEFIAERVDGCKTGAEAVLRIFSEDKDIDSTPMDVFTRLRDWERTGLLEDLSLTLKRNQRPAASDGDPDDVVVTYDQLSDGEQMLLGRMGLLFLLRGQDGSLLLLDEPETHFNDVWKREIVEMVDLGLLNSTQANVVVATHTSIALTDAFAAEVTVLDKTDEGTVVRGVSGGLFGTDPSEVSMNLFNANSNTGARSTDILDRLLKTEWKGRESELAETLKLLGSSFHRAELRAILARLREKIDGNPSR